MIAKSTRDFATGDVSLTSKEYYLAGGMAGVTNSVISGPIEHVRIRLQTQKHGSGQLYSSPFDCVKKIYRQAGIAGIYRGQAVTVLREFHGYGIWFATYEGLVSYAMQVRGEERQQVPGWVFALCGGVAGEVLWLGSHPLDVIKSRMQSDGFGENRKFKSMRDCFGQTWRAGGVRALFSGLTPALLRAMPVSAGTFAA